MRKAISVLFIFIFIASCVNIPYVKNIFKTRISVQEAVDKKIEMDKTNNPAFIFNSTRELKNTRVHIEDIKVKDIIDSTNVDYKFCVLVSAPSTQGNIDCYIYAGTGEIFTGEDIKRISKLKKDETIIDVEGDFNRFFTLFDETYTKIEIVNANIRIKTK